MKTSMAAVFGGVAGQIELQDLPLPEIRNSEILVRVLGCTLCGSDLHSFEGRRAVPVPTVLGHEIVGEIVDFGDVCDHWDLAGQPLRRGDRVTWAIVAHCGNCPLCQRGLPQKCQNAVKFGHEALSPGRELLGGLAAHCLLVPGTSVVRLPADLPLAVACPASCATATVTAALEAAGTLEDRSLCVFGAGMLGLTACAMAKVNGAAEIVCVDPVPSRRARALQFGATRAVAPEELADIAGGTVGRLGFDAVIELSGSRDAVLSAWPLLRLGGVLVLVGSVFPSAPIPVLLEQVVRRQLTIRGIHNYAPHHLLGAVNFLAANHQSFPFADLVTHWFSLPSIAEAFAESARGEAVRIGVAPPASHGKGLVEE